MTNREIVVSYRDTVLLLNSIQNQIKWNDKFFLPVKFLAEKMKPLCRELLMFEYILSDIKDIRMQNVIRCRYALGMTIEETAERMKLCTMTINKLEEEAWGLIQAWKLVQSEGTGGEE